MLRAIRKNIYIIALAGFTALVFFANVRIDQMGLNVCVKALDTNENYPAGYFPKRYAQLIDQTAAGRQPSESYGHFRKRLTDAEIELNRFTEQSYCVDLPVVFSRFDPEADMLYLRYYMPQGIRQLQKDKLRPEDFELMVKVGDQVEEDFSPSDSELDVRETFRITRQGDLIVNRVEVKFMDHVLSSFPCLQAARKAGSANI